MSKPRLQPRAPTVESAEKTCPGTTVAFNCRDQFAREPHSRQLLDARGSPASGLARSWGTCWHCGRALGCTICTTTNEREVLCRACGAWGTKAALLHHGPMNDHGGRKYPQLAAYPADWVRDYEPPGETAYLDVRGTVRDLAERVTSPARDVRMESEEEWA